MNTGWYRFEAADVWFFRDARPFNQGEPAQIAMRSLFPPHPSTAVGALRAALARGLGWNGRGRWNGNIAAVLGDGDKLDGLQFVGPYLVHGLAGPLFPAPAMLVRDNSDDGRLCRLSPGPVRICDYGKVRLAMPPSHARKVKALTGAWITRAGMQRILCGGVPARKEIYLAGEEENDVKESLFAQEVRIGLARDPQKRTAIQGALYTAGFVRPHATEDIGLVLGVDGLQGAPEPASPIPFGGEGRFAWVRSGDAYKVALPDALERFN